MPAARGTHLARILSAGLTAAIFAAASVFGSCAADPELGTLPESRVETVPAPTPTPGIRLNRTDTTETQFELHGVDLPEDGEWSRLFPIRVAAAAPDSPAMIGRYEVRDEVLTFTPRFPLTPGVVYRAVWSAGDLSRSFEIPKPDPGPRVQLREVFPSSGVLPENLLRFYLHFSAPVARGDVYRHIQLLDHDRKPIELPFLEIGEELWDRSGTRLTLLFDPGRIKNELRPRLEEGPILVADREYTLRIDAGWQDLHGRPLAAPFEKRFRTGPADTTQPDPQRWVLSTPRAGTTEPLEVRFRDAVDHALLQHMIDVVGPDDDPVDGVVEVLDEETLWRFCPTRVWADGSHHLEIDTELEDVVGNSIRSSFEVDVHGKAQPRIERETVRRNINLRR